MDHKLPTSYSIGINYLRNRYLWLGRRPGPPSTTKIRKCHKQVPFQALGYSLIYPMLVQYLFLLQTRAGSGGYSCKMAEAKTWR